MVFRLRHKSDVFNVFLNSYAYIKNQFKTEGINSSVIMVDNLIKTLSLLFPKTRDYVSLFLPRHLPTK